MRTALLLLLALAALGQPAILSAADVWKWVDSKGVTHYSDQPVPGAVKIEIRSGNVAESRPAAAADSGSDDSQDAAASYRTLQIVQPESNQAIINTGGQVNVEVRVAPSLQASHTLSLYLDGNLVTGFPRNTQLFALKEVPRGTHSVRVAITDASGDTIQESPSVGFNVRQESIANPPVGPSLGQPPKPQPRPRPQNRATNKVLTKQPSYNALNGGTPAIDPKTNMPVEKKPAPKPGKP